MAKTRKHLTEAEVAALIDAAGSDRWSNRNRTMLAFCFRHGLRVSELVALRWADIDWTGKNVVIMRRKQRTATGTRVNFHPLSPDESKALKKLYSEYGAESDFVFATERRGADGRFQGFTTAGFAILLRRLEARPESLILARTLAAPSALLTRDRTLSWSATRWGMPTSARQTLTLQPPPKG